MRTSLSLNVVAIGAALAVVALGGAWLYLNHPLEEAVSEDPVFSREVVEYENIGKDVVKYAYKGEALPEKLAEDEVVELRTTSSYTRAVDVQEDSTTYETRIYSGEAFVEEGGVWYVKEFATTTETAFNASMRQNPIAALFVQEVHAASISPFSEAGDGEIENSGSDYNTVHDAISGSNFSYTNATAIAGVLKTSGGDYFIYRSFFPFDTSSIPASAVISAATFNGYVIQRVDTMTQNIEYITVVQTSQTTHTQLATADYDQAGAVTSPTEGVETGNRVQISTATLNAYATFTLNSTGIGWVKKNGQASSCSVTPGITCLGFREGHDTTRTTPNTNNTNAYAAFSTSEESGTSKDPYLTVTYSIPFAPWQFWDF